MHYRLKLGTTPQKLIADIILERDILTAPTWGQRLKGSLDMVPTSLHDTTKQTPDSFTPVTTAFKTKNCLPIPRAELIVPQLIVAEPQVEVQPTVHVNKRVLQALRALFYDDSSSGTTETPWVDFVQAMVLISFSATKTQSSEWQFVPQETNLAHGPFATHLHLVEHLAPENPSRPRAVTLHSFTTLTRTSRVAMARRHRTVRELSAQIASLQRHEIGQFVSSLSEKESRALAVQTAQSDSVDGLTKQQAILLSQGLDPMSAIIALPKEQQNAHFDAMTQRLQTAISYGDHVAETMTLGYQMQLEHLRPKTTTYGKYLQGTAEALSQLGLTDRDIDKERAESETMASELLECWDKLRSVLQSHESLVQTRWLKMTRSERKQILLSAWPDMPERHRPDMEHFLNGKRFKLEGFDMRAAIWPYINLEDLLRPKALLIFLNSRGRSHPCHFAYSDLESCTTSIGPIFQIQSEPPRLSDQEDAVEKVGIHAREALYRLPAQLDLERLRVLVSAQRSQAIDHAWALRENPGYFASTAEEYREHRCELILDKFGNTHPHASDFPLWNKAVRHTAADAHCLVFVWDEILQRILNVQDLLSQHSANISIDEALPDELHDKLSELRFFVEAVMLNQIGDLNIEFQASPGLRQYHYRANPEDSNLRKFDIRVCEPPQQNASLRRVLELKGAIRDSGCRDCFTMHVLMNEFERLMQSDPRARALVSAHIAKSLSRLSIYAECLHQLHLFQPWAHQIESDIEDRKAFFAARYDQIFKHWGYINVYYQKFEEKKLNVLCSPCNSKFAYPAHEHPTRAKVEQMRSAESALDNFWEAANGHWMRLIHTTPVALVKHIMGERNLVRTQPWAPLAAAKTTKRGKKSRVEPQEKEAFSEHAHDVTKQVTGGFTKTTMSIRSKTKTKGVANDEDADEALPMPLAILPPAPRSTLKVDKRSLDRQSDVVPRKQAQSVLGVFSG
ncbi:hypothetical protein E8E11_003292 [Didymella keratinophila]|nr:hypothetical protein E8E11_003292 [Didymella keratinophila]